VIGALCLATDLGMGLPFEHGLQSTIIAMRLADNLGVDSETAVQIYYGCQLFYVGCTVDAEMSAENFDDGVLLTSASYTLVAGMVALMGFAVGGALVAPDAAPLHGWAGLYQRLIILAVVFPCRIVLSVRLLQVATGRR
jgi:hypothetical protein